MDRSGPPGNFMRRVVLACGVLCLASLLSASPALVKPTETIPLSQIRPGMQGVAYTVFEGTKPESMNLEVLGVLKNANGPKGDIILVRLKGEKVEYTGVVAGSKCATATTRSERSRSSHISSTHRQRPSRKKRPPGHLHIDTHNGSSS